MYPNLRLSSTIDAFASNFEPIDQFTQSPLLNLAASTSIKKLILTFLHRSPRLSHINPSSTACMSNAGSMSPSVNAQIQAGSMNPKIAGEISFKDKIYHRVREGLADILNLPSADAEKGGSKQSVFYNPIQQFNRDLSVLAIRVFAEDLANLRCVRRERRTEKLAKEGRKGTKRKRGDVSSCREPSKINRDKRQERPETLEEHEQSGGPRLAESTQQTEGQEGAIPIGFSTTAVNPSLAVDAGAISKNLPPSNGQVEQPQPDSNAPQTQHEDLERDHAIQQERASTNTATPFRILDALSATGLRALRYVKEIPHVTSVTANDLSSSATASIKLNAEYNGVVDKIQPTVGDAKALMYHTIAHNKDLFHVIDLDPYGTAVPFLDAAVQAVPDGGLLCVTCTDAGVFASVGFPEKTFSQYGGVSWKGTQGHEAGLRLILNAVASSAARYGLAVEPLLSLNIDFYARLFVRIRKSPADVKFLASKTMVIYNCDHGCSSFNTQYLAQSREREAKNGEKFYNHSLAQGPSATPFCDHCGFKTHLAGPMWGGPLHNPHFITKILDLLPSLDNKIYGTIPRIEGMLTLALNETLFPDSQKLLPSECNQATPIIPLDPALRDPHPFFINPSILARTLHCPVPSDAALRGALIGLGYRTTRSHTEPGSIRTDAPWNVIWEIMREWVRQKHPIKAGALKKGMAGLAIMGKDRSLRELEHKKQGLRKIIDGTENLESLQTSIENALFRLSKIGTEAEGNKEHNGALQEVSNGTQRHDLKVVFDERLGKAAAGKKMLRYQMNPRPDWGPMSKAKDEQ